MFNEALFNLEGIRCKATRGDPSESDDSIGRGDTTKRVSFRVYTETNDVKSVSTIWGYSSAGRAPALQAGGQRFDPAYLHHILSLD